MVVVRVDGRVNRVFDLGSHARDSAASIDCKHSSILLITS